MDKASEILGNMSIFSKSEGELGQKYSKMFRSWEQVVGPKLAGYSRIRDLKNNSLIVEGDHPAILQMLQFKYREILNRLDLYYPELKIKDLRLLLRDRSFGTDPVKRTYEIYDGVDVEKKSEEFNLEKIDNEPFRKLLEGMKKRSQEDS